MQWKKTISMQYFVVFQWLQFDGVKHIVIEFFIWTGLLTL